MAGALLAMAVHGQPLYHMTEHGCIWQGIPGWSDLGWLVGSKWLGMVHMDDMSHMPQHRLWLDMTGHCLVWVDMAVQTYWLALASPGRP